MSEKHDDAEVQAFYRDVNERIAAVNRRFDTPGAIEILCECGRRVRGARAARAGRLRKIRWGATHFALLDGHQNPAVEDVVRRGDGYLVVANYGPAATTARRTDPRASSR